MSADAYIQHRIGDRRVRLKFPDRRGDQAYFAQLRRGLEDFADFDRLEANALTGGLLIEGRGIDLDKLSSYARKNDLFDLHDEKPPGEPFADRMARPIQLASQKISDASDGELDLPSALFVLLLAFGLIEIARGNFRTPPWYTAFWYAFGVYSKVILDRASAQQES